MKKNYIAIGVIALAIILIGNIVVAENGTGSGCATINGVEFCNSAKKLGGASFVDNSPTNLTDLEIANDLLVHGDSEFVGTSTFTATTTMPLNSVSNISVNLTEVASSSAANPPVAGSILNTGAPKLCSMPSIFRAIANGKWGGNWTVGTTTALGHSSLTATATATLIARTGVATSTTGLILNPELSGQGGSYYPTSGLSYATSSLPWVWGSGEYLVANNDHSGATTTDTSFDTTLGYTVPHTRLITQCWDAY